MESSTLSVESLQSISVDNYKALSREYTTVVREPQHREGPNLDPDLSQRMERYLPEVERQGVLDFSAKLTSMMPDSLDMTLEPTSTLHLKAMVAAAYLKEKPTDPQDKEMYTRALASLTYGFGSFSNDFGSTDDAIYEFVGKGYSKDNFYNFSVQLLGSTMPVAAWSSSKDERYTAFKEYKRQMDGEIDKVKSVLKQKAEKYIPGYDPNKIDGIASPVYVDDINRDMPFTNDFQANERRQYNSAVSAAAITFGIDEVTGLDLVIYRLPYNYDYDEEKLKTNGDKRNADRPAYKETESFIHESIHNLPEKDLEGLGDWKILINELLTDSATIAIQVEAHGGEFGTDSAKPHRAITGYVTLVNMAEDLVAAKVVTTDELVEYGLNQDPDGFLNILGERIKNKDEFAQITAEAMLRWRLIPLAKTSEIPEIVKNLQQDPVGYMQKEMMAMWRMVGRGYLAEPMYILAINDKLKEDPEYSEKIKAEFSQVTPNDTFQEGSGYIFKPGSARLFTDEAVNLFRKYYAAEVRETPYSGYAEGEPLAKYLIDNIDSIQLGDTLPEELKINGLDNTARVAEIVRVTNDTLGHFFYYKQDEALKPEFVVKISGELYKTIGSVFQKNWGEKGIKYDYRDIVRVIRDLMPQWYKTFEARPQTVEELLEGTRIRLDALTSEIEPVDGYKFIPTQDQVFHYGGALNLAKEV